MTREAQELPESERERGTVLFLRARDSGSADDLAALTRWIGEDTARRNLVRGLARVWSGVGQPEEAPVAPTPQAANDDTFDTALSARRGRSSGLIAASVALILMVGAALLLSAPRQAVEEKRFATAIGEHKQVTLSDGTQVLLDAASSLSVEYDDDARVVRLAGGQAYFDVAHDPDRPFHVEVDGTDVRALGTEFNVALDGRSASVSLVDGSVLVSDLSVSKSLFGLIERDRREPIVTLRPGESFARDSGGTAQVRRFDPATVSAWRDGRIVFEDLPLPRAVAIVNRYSRRPVTLDPGLPATPMTGVFDAGDGIAFAETVTAYIPGTRVEVSENSIAIRAGE